MKISDLKIINIQLNQNKLNYLPIIETAFADEFPMPNLAITHGNPHHVGKSKLEKDNLIYYSIQDEKNIILAFIGVGQEINGYLPIHKISNVSKIKGLITNLLIILVRNDLKFVIENEEPLTLYGKNWLIKLIDSNNSDLKLTDQDGIYPNVEVIEKEWIQSKIALRDGKIWHGLTTIYIENK